MNRGIRQELEKQYSGLFEKYGLERPLNAQNVSAVIKQSLRDFLSKSEKPAIYCNGGHTKMLMADFMAELKKVRHIVDNYAVSEEGNGFILIKDDEMEEQGIDAVILSSYKFRKELKKSLEENHPELPVLDIYDEFEKKGITVQSDYYYSNHPYQHYKRINQLQREIRENCGKAVLDQLYIDLVTKYIHIKDFRTAAVRLREWREANGTGRDRREEAGRLLEDVEELYRLQKEAAASLSEDHVLMFCLDGLRYRDLSEKDMPKLKRMLDETGFQFTNAYSYSTSTFEGLIPVYSENYDLRTKYYEKNSVDIKACRFASLAQKQDREIYIYADVEHFIEEEKIHYSEQFLTVTEKLWQFILDACETESGLFYLHEQYESHFTFSNPYTEAELRSEGTAMLFDFLPVKGGHLRTDYARQHEDAIHYLDDVAEPLLRPLKCRILVYADHGNLVLDYETKLSDIGNMEYTCSEGWTRIPLALRSPEMGTGTDHRLITLAELNRMVISLLLQEAYHAPDVEYIKLARSELYNPDFRFLYQMTGKELYLQAFECFVFRTGRKLMVYADGTTELYDIKDHQIDDEAERRGLFERVRGEITVTAKREFL